MPDPQNPMSQLRASMEVLRSWRGAEGDKRALRRVATEALRTAQSLVEGRKVELVIELRRLAGHAQQAVAEYAYVPEPPGTSEDRIIDGHQWLMCLTRLLYYITIAGTPRMSSAFRQRRPFVRRPPPAARTKKGASNA